MMGNTQAAYLAATPETGSSAGYWALVAALAWSLPPGRWRRLAVGVMLSGLTLVAVTYHRLFDVQHLLSATLVLTVLTTRRWPVARADQRREHTHSTD